MGMFCFEKYYLEKNVKAPNLIERAKEEIDAVIHSEKSPHHDKETHGTSNDIDENTPIDEVKGPGLFERAKEELEALVEVIHPKKESGSQDSSPKKGDGCLPSIGTSYCLLFTRLKIEKCSFFSFYGACFLCWTECLSGSSLLIIP
ncbi:hypothetical protein GIB67_041659 [Kingdonia uniflora]|uniref:Uncharacterized protein n=1 Tax=Kingdonia uniflora TaxID=39325 RepID=A0A7J7MR54_9MAGN|nr:hypothetical protein GIB67_041659 [Kingdonia uniflora]